MGGFSRRGGETKQHERLDYYQNARRNLIVVMILAVLVAGALAFG